MTQNINGRLRSFCEILLTSISYHPMLAATNLRSRLIISTWGLSAYPLIVYAAGNVTCKDSSLDWYTDYIGETPCMCIKTFFYTWSLTFKLA